MLDQPAMLDQLAQRIAAGLQRKAITNCGTWAEKYRYMGGQFPGPWSFKYHPWAKEMHNASDELLIGQKAAQMGYTEACLNKCFYTIDMQGTSVLYILPSEGDSSDFSSSRFDPALEQSPHLQNIFSNVKNIGHKRAGNASLFVRGSRSKSKLKSLPVSFIVFDEVDEMDQENITLAFERMSGHIEKQAWMISTPTAPNYGINKYYNRSTQEHFFFKCPSCGRQTELVFPECVVITADEPSDPAIKNTHLICKECQAVLPHETKHQWLKSGEWVPSFSNRMSRGFYINQLYSSTTAPYELAALWLTAQYNPTDAQEFYNSKMGIVYVPEGAQITDEMLEECTGSYVMPSKGQGFVTMGIDVGSWLHYEITQYIFEKDEKISMDLVVNTKARVLKMGKVTSPDELDVLIKQYSVQSVVIDHQPETRMALELANRFFGMVRLCIYGQGVSGKNIHEHAESEHKVTVDRTSWLDASLSRFKTRKISLPKDTPQEYKEQIKSPVRVYRKDKSGNPMGKYVHGNQDDHYAHARNYCEIALAVGMKAFESTDIESPL